MSDKPKPVKEKKPRASKKTPPVVAIVSPQGVMGSFLPEQRPLIAHLPVSTASLNFDATNELKYDPVVPDVPLPYEHGTNEMSFLEGMEGSGVMSDRNQPKVEQNQKPATTVTTPGETKCKLPSNYAEKLMVLFQDSNRY
jgi:hypothetical protein